MEASEDESSKKTPKKRDRDKRVEKACPFCSLVVKQHLDRHLMRVHQSEVPTREDAKKLAANVTARATAAARKKAPISIITQQEIGAIYGTTLQLPGVSESTIKLLETLHVRVVNEVSPEDIPVPEPPQPQLEPGHQENKTVKKAKKEMGLYDCLPSTFRPIAKYQETRDTLGKNKKATVNSCRRIVQVLAYAKNTSPRATPGTCWSHIKNVMIC